MIFNFYPFYLLLSFVSTGILALGLVGVAVFLLQRKNPFICKINWALPILLFFVLHTISPVLAIVNRHGSNTIAEWVFICILGIALLALLMVLRTKPIGFDVFGVTDKSFREALLRSLRLLEIKYEERFSGLFLISKNVELRISPTYDISESALF